MTFAPFIILYSVQDKQMRASYLQFKMGNIDMEDNDGNTIN